MAIDQDLCIGCGACVAISNDIFALDEKTMKVKIIKQPTKETEEIKMAIESCPVEAIKIIDN